MSSVHSSPPAVIDVKAKKAEVPSIRCRTPHTPQIHDWNVDFWGALMSSFDSKVFREALKGGYEGSVECH